MWRLDRSHVGIIRHSATEAIPMIEARDEQPLLSSSGIGNGPPPTSPDKSRRKNKRRLKGEASVSPIMNSGQYYNATSSSSSTPQSVEPYSEYTRPLSATFPLQQPNTNNASNANGNGGVISPLTAGGLPPAIPMRSRINSSGDRSIGELSTVSGASGHARSRSIGGGRSRSPKPHRSRSSFSGGVTANGGPPPRSRSPPNVGMMNMNMNAQPLHQRRSSDEYSSNRYQRSNSYDMRDQQQQQQTLLVRGMSSNSLYSMNSATGSVHSETLRLLPDPRWGGGSGHNRVRSFSSGSGQALLRGSNHANMQYSSSGSSPRVNISNISYSTDSMEGKQQQPFGGINYGGHYGSISSFGTKEIIPPMNMATRQHRRTHSEVSAASLASAVSIDKSVEPVMTNMTKSSMFKGVTNEGVVKMQLPKDNFRLLSDRDLESGRVYKRSLVDNEDDYFLDYHVTITEDGNEALAPASTSDCQCTCPSCTNCQARRKQLPPSYYVMAVDSDIYRRMFDEVAESMAMPCKTFYCGHHEDVDYPSVGIAVVGVIICFSLMLWAMIYVDG